MKKKHAAILTAGLLLIMTQCGKSPAEDVPQTSSIISVTNSIEPAAPAGTIDNTANWLGGLKPEDALQYMKDNYDKGLVIVEVNTDYWKLQNGFTHAMHIPHDEMETRFNEIPADVPVILHCGGGVVSVPAYEILMENRKDIPQLSYIAGRPIVSEFNEWLANKEGNDAD